MTDLTIPDHTINPQITDSVTQNIKYKEGFGFELPKNIEIKFMNPMTFEDAILKYSDQKDFHVPSIKELSIIHQHKRHLVKDTEYLTTKNIDENNVIVVNIFYDVGTYTVVSKKEPRDLLLVYIE
jgi:hypothetical protein